MFGKKALVILYQAWNQKIQYYKCQGFDYNPKAYKRKIAYGLYGYKHFTKNHKCDKYGFIKLYNHQKAKCGNYDDKDYSPRSSKYKVLQTNKAIKVIVRND